MRAANTRLDLIDLGCMGRHEPEVEARPGGEFRRAPLGYLCAWISYEMRFKRR